MARSTVEQFPGENPMEPSEDTVGSSVDHTMNPSDAHLRGTAVWTNK